jgi:hypothetical protein
VSSVRYEQGFPYPRRRHSLATLILHVGHETRHTNTARSQCRACRVELKPLTLRLTMGNTCSVSKACFLLCLQQEPGIVHHTTAMLVIFNTPKGTLVCMQIHICKSLFSYSPNTDENRAHMYTDTRSLYVHVKQREFRVP